MTPWSVSQPKGKITQKKAIRQHITVKDKLITLPDLQKTFGDLNFCGLFLRMCLRGFCFEKHRGFLVNFFLVSVSHGTKHENTSNISGKIQCKIRGKFRAENSKNSRNFRSASFLT